MLFLLGQYKVIEIRAWTFLPYAIVALFLQGIASEVLFRGIFFPNIVSWLGKNIAVLLLCTVYASLNLLIDGGHLQVFVGHWLFFCMLSLLYLKTENLWVTGALHGTWLVVAFMPGVVDEHWRDGALIITKVQGARWLTGGQWGAELSIFCIAIMAAASVFCILLKNQGRCETVCRGKSGIKTCCQGRRRGRCRAEIQFRSKERKQRVRGLL
ncbi:MAG: hypothetical protein ACI8UP_005421, partial [Porticoccaceae bacterium]